MPGAGRVTVFDRIYRSNAWNGGESRSGPGSGRAATDPVARALVELVAELGITTVLDVGCGDGFWMPAMPRYVGIDVSKEAIKLARLNHPDREYMVWDVVHFLAKYHTGSRTGGFDLVIVRDAIQHLPLAQGEAVLSAIQASGSTWLLASHFVGGANVDVDIGGAYSPDLTAPPFSMGRPDRWIFDGYAYDGSGEVRDPDKVLSLWRLAS